MATKKIFISNERMLDLMAWAIQTRIADNETAYLEMIGFPRTNISNVRTGHQSFTKEHIWMACKITGATADYIFGFTNVMLRKKPVKPLEVMKVALHALELDLRNGHR